MKRLIVSLIVSLMFLSSLFAGETANPAQIRKKLAQYTPVNLRADASGRPVPQTVGLPHGSPLGQRGT